MIKKKKKQILGVGISIASQYYCPFSLCVYIYIYYYYYHAFVNIIRDGSLCNVFLLFALTCSLLKLLAHQQLNHNNL